jgi:D-serine deaminase-like pyridoxal phosphate-dependent protein
MSGDPEQAPGSTREEPTPVSGYDHADAPTPVEPAHTTGDRPQDQHARFEQVFAEVEPPFAFVDMDAVWSNAADMLRRAGGVPIRVATKSVRCRAILERALSLDRGFQGLLTFTMPETLFLWERGFRNLVLAYPCTDREWLAALARLTAAEPEAAPVTMVDSIAHLDLIEGAAADAGTKSPVRVAIDVDAGLRLFGGAVAIGPKRSPVYSVEQADRLAREISRRPGVKLVGLMAYEGQVAGVGDRVPGKPLRSLGIRAMQKLSMRDLRERRAAIAAAVGELAPLEFVNGGGTGSLELTAAEPAVTELSAGSGFYAPVLFDHYRSFQLRPAAMFALPVSRKPTRGIATALGGGYPASGAGARDRLPQPYLPAGLHLDSNEGAGEVQTPLLGEAAEDLEVGDRVYFRHVKAGELCERFNSLYLVAGDTIVDEAPTYRGEGKAFL